MPEMPGGLLIMESSENCCIGAFGCVIGAIPIPIPLLGLDVGMPN
jgi:hypothetical protein